MTLWHIWIFDAIAWLLLLSAFLLAVGISVRPLRRWIWERLFLETSENAVSDPQSAVAAAKRLERTAVVLGIIGGYLAVYMAYGTLRNQSMLAAKSSINADAGRLLDWERTRPQIRCLYNWYSTHDDGDACLATIAADADLFSEASLYIEEVFFIFKQARQDERMWRSGYVESIWYWRAGVEEDPTGLFGNYLATSPPGTKQSVRNHIQASSVAMPNVCDAHYRVRACFRSIGQDVSFSQACQNHQISNDVAETLPKLIATCRAAAEEHSRPLAAQAGQLLGRATENGSPMKPNWD